MVWMQRPPQMPGVPPGLEYLTQVDELQVQQHASLTEALIGWEKNNKYAIYNSANQQIFYAMEETVSFIFVYNRIVFHFSTRVPKSILFDFRIFTNDA